MAKGFQQDNPEFRNMDEYLGAMQRIGMYAEQSPEMLKAYLSNPDFKPMLQRLGYSDANQLYNDAISGKFTPEDYVSPSKFGGMATETGNYYAGLENTLKGYENDINGMSGELTPYGDQFNFSAREFDNKDISNVPDEVYQGMMDMQNEQAAQGFQGALGQLGEKYGAMGFRPGSGFEQASGSSLGRSYLDQLTNISRDVGMQKANSKLDLSKFQSGQDLDRNKFLSSQDMQRQGLQAQENNMRNAYLTDLQKYAKNFGLQKGQTLSGMGINRANLNSQGKQQEANYLGMQQAGAYTPYEMGQTYYGQTAPLEGPKSKNVFEKVMGGIGAVAGGVGSVIGGLKR